MSNTSSERPATHPAIVRAVARHREFFAGTRRYLVKVYVPVTCADLEPVPAFDTLDWARDFDDYVRTNVANAVRRARARLALGIDDDTIPCYHPYFGISIHASFFGGAVSFGGGTSYMAPLISRAADWPQLRADFSNPWTQRLLRGLAYCRDHGEGVLCACLRGANGPLDMVNAVLGEALFTEIYDDAENLGHTLDVCTRAALDAFAVQKQHASCIEGGYIVPMGGLWVPAPMAGHISLDAACLMHPDSFVRYERPWIETMADACTGFMVHTHMLGRHAFRAMCETRGVALFAPVDDPKQPPLLDDLDATLAAAGDVPLMLSVPTNRLDDVLPRCCGRRTVLCVTAESADAARALLDRIGHELGPAASS